MQEDIGTNSGSGGTTTSAERDTNDDGPEGASPPGGISIFFSFSSCFTF